MQEPPFNAGSFAAGVTYDATPAAGAAAACVDNVRSIWAALVDLGANKAGRRTIRLAPPAAAPALRAPAVQAAALQA